MVKQTQNYILFCNLEDEITYHLFAICTKTNILWTNIKEFFNGNLKLPSLTPQSAMFRFSDVDQDIFLVLNHILLLFKHFIYISRESIILLFYFVQLKLCLLLFS